MTYNELPYDSRLPYEPRRVTIDDILDDQIDVWVDHFKQCFVCDDKLLSLMSVQRYDTTWGDAIHERKRLVDEMRWQRLKLVASFQEAFWPLPHEAALPFLGSHLRGKVASLFNLMVGNNPFFGYSGYWGGMGERKYNESVDFMLRNPDANYDWYEMEFSVKGQQMPYTEDLFNKVRKFLSPLACKVFTSRRWADVRI